MTATTAPRRTRAAAALLGLLLAVAGALVPSPAVAADPVRVMFLGDSITGVHVPVRVPEPVPDPVIPLPDPACDATLRVQSMWPGGFVAVVEVRALDATLGGWRVGMYLLDGTAITHAWNAELERGDGHVVARNAAWNGTLPPRGTTSFGFVGTGSPDGITAPSCGWG